METTTTTNIITRGAEDIAKDEIKFSAAVASGEENFFPNWFPLFKKSGYSWPIKLSFLGNGVIWLVVEDDFYEANKTIFDVPLEDRKKVIEDDWTKYHLMPYTIKQSEYDDRTKHYESSGVLIMPTDLFFWLKDVRKPKN